jgi:DNA-directed RNA polymerase specialized sigma24 family protein
MNAHIDAPVQRMLHLYSLFVRLVCQDARLQEADAEDIRQEVLIVVWRKQEKAEDAFARGRWRSWLRVITLNKIRDRLRSPRRDCTGIGGLAALRWQETFAVAGPSEEAEGPAVPDYLRALYERAVGFVAANFSGRAGEMFWRMVLHDARPVELAVEFHTSAGAVYRLKSRILSGLRAELAGSLGLPEDRAPALCLAAR